MRTAKYLIIKKMLQTSLTIIYFINVAQKLEPELGECNSSYQDYLKNPNESSFFLGETELGEIIDFINELKIEKSPSTYMA